MSLGNQGSEHGVHAQLPAINRPLAMQTADSWWLRSRGAPHVNEALNHQDLDQRIVADLHRTHPEVLTSVRSLMIVMGTTWAVCTAATSLELSAAHGGERWQYSWRSIHELVRSARIKPTGDVSVLNSLKGLRTALITSDICSGVAFMERSQCLRNRQYLPLPAQYSFVFSSFSNRSRAVATFRSCPTENAFVVNHLLTDKLGFASRFCTQKHVTRTQKTDVSKHQCLVSSLVLSLSGRT